LESRRVELADSGIQRALRKRFDTKRAICEFIWNGFDARASVVNLDYETNEFGVMAAIEVRDNGNGIKFQFLDRTFAPFWESIRALQQGADGRPTTVHGKNGIGRFSFFVFANKAEWLTTFADDDGHHRKFSITMTKGSLHEYETTEPESSDSPTGTVVRFTGISASVDEHMIDNIVSEYALKQFAWLLELNASRDFKLIINGTRQECEALIDDSEETEHNIRDGEQTHSFGIRFIRWAENLGKAASKYHYVGSDSFERGNEKTPFSRRGDGFYHSVYVKSNFFDLADTIGFATLTNTRSDPSLFGKHTIVFQKLRDHLDSYLHNKRHPFIQESAGRLLERYESEGVLPTFGESTLDLFRRSQLHQLVRELYQVQPKLFRELNAQQKITFLMLLNLLLEERDREEIFAILEHVLGLSPPEREQFLRVLQRSRLSNVIRTIALIEDRFKAVAQLEKLVYDEETYANERDHLQKLIESNYWLFGEEYELVTADKGFAKAMRNFIYRTTGETETDDFDHPNKLRRMDIFATQVVSGFDRISCLVVELKSPSVDLGSEEFLKLDQYRQTVLADARWKNDRLHWQFMLVGKERKDDPLINSMLETAKVHGETSLVSHLESGRVKTYVKRWSEILTDFTLRHNFLLEKLELERDELIDENSTAEDIIRDQAFNSAARPGEPVIPSKPKRL